jgi:hypothetical protein
MNAVQTLAVYLHDHLAGAGCALDLVESLKENYRGQELGEFAAQLQLEITADKEILHKLASEFGPTSDLMKDSAAWLAEKLSRFKLAHSESSGLGLFEALEFLELGIHGKCALWRALGSVADLFGGLDRVSFPDLIERAEKQEQSVEQHRLMAARKAFTPCSSC